MTRSNLCSRPHLVVRVLAICAALTVMVISPDASLAAETSHDVQQTIDQAQEQYNGRRYGDALESFLKAYEASNFPGLLFPIARCHEELGQLDEAARAYQGFLDRADAPPDARGKADMALRLLRKRMSVGTLVVQVSPFGADVAIDGNSIGPAPVAPLKLDPGTHELLVRAPDFTPSTHVVEVGGGKTVTVVVTLVRAPAINAGPDGPGGPTLIKMTSAGGDSFARWTWVSLSVGAAAVVVGGIVYGLGERDHQQITSADGYGTAGTVGMTRIQALALDASGDEKKLTGAVLMSVGGAAVLTSVVLFVLRRGGETPASSARDVSPGLSVGPGNTALTLSGRF